MMTNPKRFGILVLFMAFASLLLWWSPLTSNTPEQAISVGDKCSDAKSMIRKWGWNAINYSWAYGFVDWQGSRESTAALAESVANKQREENDFNYSPFYQIGTNDSLIVWICGKNGVVTEIAKGERTNLDPIERNVKVDWEWETGFISVSKDFEFSK